MSRNQAFAASATVAVLLGLAVGFRQAGSPGLQRLAHADEARAMDLNAISFAVRNHYAIFKRLPRSLTELSGSNPVPRLNDPETRRVYDYRALDEGRFELCAVFSTDNRREVVRPPARLHGAGRQCFTYPE